jgi:hypothetical protein
MEEMEEMAVVPAMVVGVVEAPQITVAVVVAVEINATPEDLEEREALDILAKLGTHTAAQFLFLPAFIQSSFLKAQETHQ